MHTSRSIARRAAALCSALLLGCGLLLAGCHHHGHHHGWHRDKHHDHGKHRGHDRHHDHGKHDH